MFDDLSDADLTALRASLRTALQSLLMGEKTAEVRYGELGEKFHAADIGKLEDYIARVNAEITRRTGCAAGAVFPVGV